MRQFTKIIYSSLVLLFFFSDAAYSHDFDGRMHFHYHSKLPPDTILTRLKETLNNMELEYEVKRYDLKDNNDQDFSVERIMISVFPDEDRSKIRTRIYFKIVFDSIKARKIYVYKTVSIGEKHWAWSAHNPFGFFDFFTRWDSEAKETPFSDEQFEFVSKMIKEIEVQ